METSFRAFSGDARAGVATRIQVCRSGQAHRNWMNSGNSKGVLGRQCSNHRHTVAMVCRDGFKISLDSCTAAAVRSCYCQNSKIVFVLLRHEENLLSNLEGLLSPDNPATRSQFVRRQVVECIKQSDHEGSGTAACCCRLFTVVVCSYLRSIHAWIGIPFKSWIQKCVSNLRINP